MNNIYLVKTVRISFFLICAQIFFVINLMADVTIPSIFSDGMVLQRDKDITIWGWADTKEEIEVNFGGDSVKGSADDSGKWSVILKAQKANSKGQTLTIKGNNTIYVKDILVGDVWICSGQSNMELRLNKYKETAEAIKSANDPNLRIITIRAASPRTPIKPQINCWGKWQKTTPKNVKDFSAVGYHFGRRLRTELKDIPIGLINVSTGGTTAEQWTSREALLADPETEIIWKDFKHRLDEFDPKTETPTLVARNLQKEWKKKVIEARHNKQPQPTRPTIIYHPLKEASAPCNMYNIKLNPIIPFAIKGFVWYQGEGNRKRGEHYKVLLSVMIADWRARWGNPNLPFYIVQLANMGPGNKRIKDNEWSELQWSQFQVARDTPNSGIVVINDGPKNDTSLHPHDKKKVGERLALWALVHDYGKVNLVYSGPLYQKSEIKGDTIRIYFTHAEGLRSNDGKELQRFQIAGADKKWFWADAKIDGKTVIVSSPKVQAPIAVRYAWSQNPAGANLTNASGLPASLFKTDDWPGITHGKVLPDI